MSDGKGLLGEVPQKVVLFGEVPQGIPIDSRPRYNHCDPGCCRRMHLGIGLLRWISSLRIPSACFGRVVFQIQDAVDEES